MVIYRFSKDLNLKTCFYQEYNYIESLKKKQYYQFDKKYDIFSQDRGKVKATLNSMIVNITVNFIISCKQCWILIS